MKHPEVTYPCGLTLKKVMILYLKHFGAIQEKLISEIFSYSEKVYIINILKHKFSIESHKNEEILPRKFNAKKEEKNNLMINNLASNFSHILDRNNHR